MTESCPVSLCTFFRAASSVDYILQFWIKDNLGSVFVAAFIWPMGRVLRQLISIPFPQRESK
jgi:hypothetical protein